MVLYRKSVILLKFSSPILQDPSTINTRSALAALHTEDKNKCWTKHKKKTELVLNQQSWCQFPSGNSCFFPKETLSIFSGLYSKLLLIICFLTIISHLGSYSWLRNFYWTHEIRKEKNPPTSVPKNKNERREKCESEVIYRQKNQQTLSSACWLGGSPSYRPMHFVFCLFSWHFRVIQLQKEDMCHLQLDMHLGWGNK